MSTLEQFFAGMTVRELSERTGRGVSEIAAFALADGSASPRSASATNGATKKRNGAVSPVKSANGRGAGAKAGLRTTDGRGDFDERVLTAIRSAGGAVRSVDIESKVGGTPEQRRAALHRLVKSKKLKRDGVARATTYTAR